MTFTQDITFNRKTFQTNNIVSRNSFTVNDPVSRNEFEADVTTQFPGVSGNALLNEDAVTPILNEDLNEILVEP